MAIYHLLQARAALAIACLALCLGLAACANSEGGQSGGGTNTENPLCTELSRQSIERDTIAEGFSVSLADELALYTQEFSGELLDDNDELVGPFFLQLTEAENTKLEVVRQEVNSEYGSIEPAIFPVNAGDSCDAFYEAKLDYLFRVGPEDAPLVQIAGTYNFQWSSARKLNAFIQSPIEQVTGSYKPSLVAEAYQNINMHLSVYSTPSETMPPEPNALGGQLGWQGEKINGDPAEPDSTAEAKNEITGTFSREL
ncbi:MAG: hypothetical protein IPJ88_13230 [Myxococcales bacterium]|nr:MAG: hypothetical protein IPJ88_13230 [Myxococcales bacterium]